MTLTPTITPTATPPPTPTRIPGMLDVEVNLIVSETYHVTDDRQPFAIVITMYNHGDNPSPELVYALIEVEFEKGAFPPLRFEHFGLPHCLFSVNDGWVNGQGWNVFPTPQVGQLTYGIRTVDPGMYANNQGQGEYRLACWTAGSWVDGDDLTPLTNSDTATITVSLRDANGDPLIDGNLTNNVDVAVVELVVP